MLVSKKSGAVLLSVASLATVLLSACGSSAPAATKSTGAPKSSASSAAPASSSSSSAPLQNASLNLGWTPQGWMLPFAYGVKEGIYKKYGINLKLQPGTGSQVTVESVANGSNTFGIGDATTMTALDVGGVKDVMIMGYIQKSAVDVIVTKASGVTNPKQLAGKALAATPTGPTYQLFPAFEQNVGLAPNSVTLDHMSGNARIPAIVGKKTIGEIGLGSIEDGPVIASEGVPVRYFPYANYGVDAAETESLMTSPKEIQNNPQLVQNMVTATLEAIKATESNPQQAAQDLTSLFPAQAPKNTVLLQQWNGAEGLLATPADKGHPLGWMAASDWTTSVSLAQKYLGVKGKVDPTSLFTNKFVLAAPTSQSSSANG